MHIVSECLIPHPQIHSQNHWSLNNKSWEDSDVPAVEPPVKYAIQRPQIDQIAKHANHSEVDQRTERPCSTVQESNVPATESSTLENFTCRTFTGGPLSKEIPPPGEPEGNRDEPRTICHLIYQRCHSSFVSHNRIITRKSTRYRNRNSWKFQLRETRHIASRSTVQNMMDISVVFSQRLCTR